MPLKDYYQILRLEAGVDKSAIKRAYRKLAMQYHPDKQKESTGSNSYFHDIQEAYEILSNPDKREQYHYERWLEHSMGNRMEGEMPAHQIIQLIIKADQHLSGTDKFRLDSYILLNHLLKLFSPAKIETIAPELCNKRASCVRLSVSVPPFVNTKGVVELYNPTDAAIPLSVTIAFAPRVKLLKF